MMYNLEFLKSLGFNAVPDNNSSYYDIKVDESQDNIGKALSNEFGDYMVQYDNGIQVKCSIDNLTDLCYEVSDNTDVSKEQKVVFIFSKADKWSVLRNVTDNIYVEVKENDKKDIISIKTAYLYIKDISYDSPYNNYDEHG